jgi:hypothetical protein
MTTQVASRDMSRVAAWSPRALACKAIRRSVRNQTAVSRQQIADSRQETPASRQQTAERVAAWSPKVRRSVRHQTAESRQQTADNRQQTPASRQIRRLRRAIGLVR